MDVQIGPRLRIRDWRDQWESSRAKSFAAKSDNLSTIFYLMKEENWVLQIVPGFSHSDSCTIKMLLQRKNKSIRNGWKKDYPRGPKQGK